MPSPPAHPPVRILSLNIYSFFFGRYPLAYLWWGGSLQASISGLEVLMANLVWATFNGGPMFLMEAWSWSMCFSWSNISCMVRDRCDLRLVWALVVSAILCCRDLLVSPHVCWRLLCSVFKRSSTLDLSLWDWDLAPENKYIGFPWKIEVIYLESVGYYSGRNETKFPEY